MMRLRRMRIAIAITIVIAVAALAVSAARDRQGNGPKKLVTTFASAVATAPMFTVAPPSVELPAPCSPPAVRKRLVGMLRAFNAGDADDFLSGFSRASFHPYASRIRGAGFSSWAEIADFVADRHRAGDGWTAVKLVSPQGEIGDSEISVYSLTVRVTQRGRTVSTRGAKIVIDCESGRVVRWLGPGVGPNDVPRQPP